nr:ribonuclease H-like domain-containing protein [Tanacetum cinerariifolium]
MEFESAQNNSTAKLPILKLENGNSWVSVPQTTQENCVSVTKMSVSATAEEKINKKNDMNKADIETMSIDDLYNNFKIVEQDVKKSVGASIGAQNMAFMTALSTSSTNDVNTTNLAYEASTDLEQIHEDDLEAMDFRWQLSLLSIRARRSQDDWFKNQDTRKQGNNEDTSSKAMMAIDAAAYKRGLATVEEQLVTYKKNEVLFSEEVAVLKREVSCKDYEINVLKSEFEKVKQEKEGIEFKIKKFDNASKSLDKLIGNQKTDNSKKGLGYHVVPLPNPLIYNGATKLDLSYSGLNEFKEPKFKGYGPRDKQVSEDTSSFVESSLNVDKETAFSVDKKIEFVKPKNHDKPVRKSVYAEMYRSQSSRGNQKNWNGQKSNQLGSNFVMYNKACFSCGSFGHGEQGGDEASWWPRNVIEELVSSLET